MFSKISRKTWFPCVSNTKTYESMEIHTMKHSIGSVHSKTHKMLVQHKGLLKSLRLTCKIISHSDCVTGSDFTDQQKRHCFTSLFTNRLLQRCVSPIIGRIMFSNKLRTGQKTNLPINQNSGIFPNTLVFGQWENHGKQTNQNFPMSPKAQESDKYHTQSYLNDRKFLFAKKPMGLGLSRLLDSSSRNPSEIGCP